MWLNMDQDDDYLNHFVSQGHSPTSTDAVAGCKVKLTSFEMKLHIYGPFDANSWEEIKETSVNKLYSCQH